MSRNNGRTGEPEVIVNVCTLDNLLTRKYIDFVLQFADGFAYSKGKMEEVFRSGFFDKQHQPTKPTKDNVLAKREDVDLIVINILSFLAGHKDLIYLDRSMNWRSRERMLKKC